LVRVVVVAVDEKIIRQLLLKVLGVAVVEAVI
jgi:hypothetical protein